MIVTETKFSGLYILTPKIFGDARGTFCETWNRETLRSNGIDIEFVQDNHSISTQKNTLRGLHYQAPPHAQAKLVRCTRGAVFDVAVDIRRDSPTYLQHEVVELTPDNARQILIPAGFLHGFLTLEPDSEVIYKCSHVYHQEADASVRYDDPEIDINWPLQGEPCLSDKDRTAPFLKDAPSPF